MALRFYTTESLGSSSKRAWTPEGFLLCSDVPIARVGTLLYGRGEIPVTANKDGIIRIDRPPNEVFNPNAILSFAGKPVTDEHPPSKVTPENWKQHAIGTVLNPHQGDGRGEDSSLLYADLLVQDRDAIRDVLAGKREVSAGYDAEYEETAPGQGVQHNIIGNHVALVDKGRCGPICSIGDSIMARRSTTPAQRRQAASFRDRIMSAFQTGDEETLVDELDKVDGMLGNASEGESINVGGKGGTSDEMGGIHVHLHNSGETPARDADNPGADATAAAEQAAPPAASGGGGMTLEALAARVDQLEQAVAILAQGEGDDSDGADDDNGMDDDSGADENSPGMSSMPPTKDRRRTQDRRASVGDSTSLRVAYAEMLSRAELLAPGKVRAPTFDAAKGARITSQTMCDVRRATINSALALNDDGKEAIMMIVGNPRDPQKHFKAMSCDAVSVVFDGASTIVRNAGGGMRGATHTGSSKPGNAVSSVTDTVTMINERNRQMYNINGR